MCDTENTKVDDVFEVLCRTLSLNGEVNSTSETFSALNTNAERVSLAKNLLQKYCLFPKLIKQLKNDELSTKCRQEGNEAFKKKNDFLAWKLYTKSISHATGNNDYLALAYANRSAVLYEKQLYKQCLEDITNAFKNNYPKHLHEKLIQREEKARDRLSNQETDKYYGKVRNIKEPNKKIQCASAKIEIRKANDLGRHVVALKHIKLGDVIAIEKPYAKVLLKDSLHDHCHACIEICYNLIPCSSCINAMYCSTKCQQSAWEQYHKYECPILTTLYSLNISKLSLLALRIAILAKKHYNEIENYKIENSLYKSQCYEEIHFLETNTHLRKSADLFPRATTAAIIGNLIKKDTHFYHDFENSKNPEDIFHEIILRQLQAGPTNFHEISECVEDNEGFFNTQEIGAGAYAFLSLLNHSCAPNVVRHCHGSEVILRAIRPITKGDELLDNYGYHYAVMNKMDRQRELRRQYYFDCNCDACENNWPLYNSMSYKGKLSYVSNRSLEALRRGDRKEAVTVLASLLNNNDDVKHNRPNKRAADAQETLKQCYALLGNRRAKF